MRRLRRGVRPQRQDVLVAGVGLACGVALWSLGLVSRDWIGGVPGTLSLVPLALMAGLELLRRTAPAAALPVAVAVLAADQLLGSLLATVVMFTDIVYSAVVYGSPRLARWVPVVSWGCTVLAGTLPVALTGRVEGLLVGAAVSVVTVVPAGTGTAIRSHRQAVAAERVRAQQAARLAELDRAAAVSAERSRMARELHDLVANHLSAIAIHSTAVLQVARDDPEAAHRALGVIRESSVAGLAEMRQLIGLLRTAAADEEPAPVSRLDALDAVLEPARAAGLAGGLTFALDDRRRPETEVPAPVGQAAYRIVQEAVTNALKHASPGPVTITLAASGDTLDVIVDSPYRTGPGPRVPGAGAGLVGMEERAALLHGTLTAGPVGGVGHGRVWRVRAELPLRPDGWEPGGAGEAPPHEGGAGP